MLLMDMKQLHRFVTVASCGGFTKAAEVLATSQPVLTRSIQLLEDALEVQLFERGQRGVALTAFGEALLPRARALVNDHQRIQTEMAILRRKRPLMVSVGATSSFTQHVIPQAILASTASHPGIEIKVLEDAFPALIRRVKEGDLDFAFGTRDPNTDLEGLTFEPLLKEQFGTIARPTHPIFANPDFALSDLVDYKWIVPDDADLVRSWENVFKGAGLPVPQLALRTMSWPLLVACLESDDFLAVIGFLAFSHEIMAGKFKTLQFRNDVRVHPAGVFSRTGDGVSGGSAVFLRHLRASCAAFVSQLEERYVGIPPERRAPAHG